MPRTLDEIVDRSRRLLELDYAELAGALGVHDTTLYRWRSGERDLSDRARDRLAGLVHLLDRVESAHPDPERRRAWLHEPLAGFGGQTPRQLLRAGSTELLAGYLLGRDAPGEERPGGVPQLGRMGRRLLETVRSAPVPMMLSAEDGEILEVSRALVEITGYVRDELRTPLNAILGSASLLGEEIPGELNADQQEHIRRIREGAEHLTSIIDETLAYFHAGTGREEPDYATVELTALAREIGGLLKPRAAEAGLDLELRLPDGGLEVETDPGKLRHVLLNLLDNAIKFTDEGAVEVTVEEVDGMVELRVADTGPGIPPEARERIFEPFVQLDQTSTRTRGGTGMGLAVVARHVEQLRGSVEVEDGPEDGSVFRVRHPIRRAG